MGKYLWLILSYQSSRKEQKKEAYIVGLQQSEGGSLTLSKKPFKNCVRLPIIESEMYIFPRFLFGINTE